MNAVLKSFYSLTLLIFTLSVGAQSSIGDISNGSFQNPILPGFSPDPSICRAGDDYYLVNSSFIWFPAIPIYHSKDLVNWKLISHGITRPSILSLDGVVDHDGIWAVTMRYHDGLFYLIGTAYHSGGNFIMTAKDPAGEWSDPVWLKDAPGIDPSLFWDDDGKCYYTGNRFDGKKDWPAQVAIWAQEFDTHKNEFIGEPHFLSYGHANNAQYAEGPHLYKVDGKYLLLCAEGGTDYNHAVTAHHSNAVFGPYVSDMVNPVLSHRQLGKAFPIQAVGHADLVQTQNGEWWAVALAKRMFDSNFSFSRETFLCKVDIENGTPMFNQGYGKVLMDQQRPNLPWTAFKSDSIRDEFNGDKLLMKWHFLRVPNQRFYTIANSQLQVKLLPQSADSLVSPAMILQKLIDPQFEISTKLIFSTSEVNEQAGLVIYRNYGSYYMLLKGKVGLVLIKKTNNVKEVMATIPYSGVEVYLKASGHKGKVQFSYGSSAEKLIKIGGMQNLDIIAESKANRFNGPGIGIYASSNGNSSKNLASFDWFEYK